MSTDRPTWTSDDGDAGITATFREDAIGREETDAVLFDAVDQLARITHPLQFSATLGEGGMGLVRLAEQLRLGRQVAVKTVRDGVTRGESVKLLQEAWITGMLEHPNIVPVYDVALDQAEHPQVVLKRIEGTAWSEFLANPSLLEDEAQADPIAWHIHVLVAVCRALEFAHSRGIVHRDLKPTNVMIGQFGEVYLLDWGIAVSLAEDDGGRLPYAGKQSRLAGTPAYLAPEMVQRGGELSGATDVFLLGAVLYEITTGRLPRTGNDVMALLASAADPIDIPHDLPQDLRQLLSAALSIDPAHRPTASAFRTQLVAHLERRDVLNLLRRTDQAAMMLSRLLETEGLDRITLYDSYGAARFGYQEALARWPECHQARQALDAVLVRMARYELGNRDARAAAIILSEFVVAPPALADELRQLESDLAREQSAHERLAADADPTTGALTRVLILVGLVGLWVVTPPILLAVGFPATAYGREAVVLAVKLISTTLVFALTFRSVFRTRTNRLLMTFITMHPVAAVPMVLAAWQWGLPIEQAIVLETLTAALFLLVGCLVVDWRILPAALVFVLVATAGIFLPAYQRSFTAAAVLFLAANVGVVWGLFTRSTGSRSKT